MKTFFYLLLLMVALFLLYGCHDKDAPSCPTCENFSEGFVIGFDPCTGVYEPNGGNVGFVVNIPSQKDTVVAYNFPTGIFYFPLEYFENYWFNPFFPDSARYDFPIKLKYRYVGEKERTIIFCRGNILFHSLFF